MRNVNTLKDLGLALGIDLSSASLEEFYIAGAGKTTVTDGDFSTTPANGTVAVHWDTSAARAYISVRANGTWHVMAGPTA